MKTIDQMRADYPLVMYTETYYEVYDEVDGKVIAFFFSKEKAQEYLDWQNEARKNRSATTEDEG